MRTFRSCRCDLSGDDATHACVTAWRPLPEQRITRGTRLHGTASTCTSATADYA